MGAPDAESTRVAVDPSSIPWNDRIKNFVMDCISFDDTKKHEFCIILTEYGYGSMKEEGGIMKLTVEAVTRGYWLLQLSEYSNCLHTLTNCMPD